MAQLKLRFLKANPVRRAPSSGVVTTTTQTTKNKQHGFKASTITKATRSPLVIIWVGFVATILVVASLLLTLRTSFSITQQQRILESLPFLLFNAATTNNNKSNDACRLIRRQLFQAAQNSRLEMNQMRRHVFLHHRDCLPALLPLFAASFASISRHHHMESEALPPTSRHVVLHIPKTAGSSLCTFLRNQEEHNNAATTIPLRVPHNSNNCFLQPYYAPIWCCAALAQTKHVQPLSCSQQQTAMAEFDVVLNENWLDPYCTNDDNDEDDNDNENNENHRTMVYSMLLREPLSRTASHMRHFEQRTLTNPKRPNYLKHVSVNNDDNPEIVWRRRLIQSNYMTWALTAHRFFGQQQPHLFRPSRPEHLDHAKERLAQMDFLLELANDKDDNKECLRQTLGYMGIYQTRGDTIPSSNRRGQAPGNQQHSDQSASAQDENNALHLNQTWLASQNTMDVELYQLARQFLRVDCEFFTWLSKQRQPQTNTQ